MHHGHPGPAFLSLAVTVASVFALSPLDSAVADVLDLARAQSGDVDGNAASTEVLLDLSAAPLTPGIFSLDLSGPDRSGRGSHRGSPPVSYIEAGSDPEGDSVAGVAFTADGSKVLIAERDSRNVVIWNADGTFDSAIDVSGTPAGIAVTPDGAWAVVPNLFEDTVSILDLVAGTESAVVAVGDQPGCVAINPSGTLAAVGNGVDGSISILSLPGGSVERTIPGIGYVATLSANFESGAIGFRMYGFQFVSDDVIVHADYYADAALFIDATTGSVNSIPIADAPQRFGLSGDRSTVVVAHTGGTQLVTVLDTATQSVTKTIPTGVDLSGGAVAVDPTGTKAVAAIQNACVVIDLGTNAISPSIDTASVNELHTTGDGLYALCVGFRGSLVSFATQSLVKNLNNVVSCSYGAVSPVAPRAAMVADTFGEDLLFLDTNGAAGFLDVATLSGPADEGDKARIVSVSPDGTLAAVSQILSDNLGIYDLTTGTLVATVAAGNRPSDVAWTPDGSKVCVANLDSSFLTVVDVPAFTATNVPLSTRGSQVEISPDGHYAYVAVVSSGDGVWRVDLGTNTLAGPKILTGDMGGISYLYSQTSGMTLSHDGSILAICGSYTDNVSFIDTASWSLLGNPVVGDFPVRATFNADDSTVYVSCRDDDRIRAVDVATRLVTSVIVAGDWPFEMALSTDETTLYVLNYLAQNVGTIDLELGSQVATVPLPNAPAGIALSAAGTELVVPTGTWSISIGPGPLVGLSIDGELNVIDIESNTIVDQIDTGVTPAMLAYDPATGLAVVPSTFIDGLYTVQLQDPAGVDPGEVVTIGPGALSAVPHPVGEEVRLSFASEKDLTVTAKVLDASGRLVRTLAAGRLTAGRQTLSWDRRDENGRRVDPGVYFVRISTGSEVFARKLVVR